ncbi:VanZ family protein [Companilactobacillus sp. FL22-1]|uniref:VanZ family protein n=1 Tax=Companilactobacillus sp. FL22-1 TaxID=3373892 RepID=UPI0037543BB0
MRWIPITIILIILSCVTLFVVHQYKNSKHFPLALLTMLYLIGISAILFTPISIDGLSVQILPPGIGRVNETRLYFHDVGFFENIILTIPLGMIIKKSVPQIPLLILAVFGIICSSGFEIAQYYLSHYFLINRTSDINDVIANTTGIIIGGLLIIIFSQFKSRIDK